MTSNPYSPIPRGTALQRRLASGKYKITPIGLEGVCTVCGDFWPADSEFFYLNPSATTGLSPRCKACDAEVRAKAKAA